MKFIKVFSIMCLFCPVFGDETDKKNVTVNVCITLSEGVKIGSLSEIDTKEVSGIGESREEEGVLWVHNDSGDKLRMIAISSNGTKLYEVTFEDKDESTDAEDMTIGPAPGEDEDDVYIYLGDIGDNDGNRSTLFIYRFKEPENEEYKDIIVAKSDYVTIKLEGQPGHNFESLFIDPTNASNLYLISKNPYSLTDEQKEAYVAKVFRVDNPVESNETPLKMEEIGSLPTGVRAPTAADICPAGRVLLIQRAVNEPTLVYVRNMDEDDEMEPLTETLKRSPNCELSLDELEQGESIAFAANGSGIYTTSESIGGANPPIYYYDVDMGSISSVARLELTMGWVVSMAVALLVNRMLL